jgi:acetyltransferase-like isoleucine patch superfamily enzyme
VFGSPIAILGYSEHSYEVLESAKESGMDVGYYTDTTSKDKNLFGLTFLGFEKETDFFVKHKNVQFIFGIGSNKIRVEVAKLAILGNASLPNVLDPSAHVSLSAVIGSGNYIGKRSVINALANIGDYCILNTGCIVEHECRLGAGVHISPVAILSGNVHVIFHFKKTLK